MKKLLFMVLLSVSTLSFFTASAQMDKSKRPSPPDTVSATLKSGVKVTVAYSQPAIKGRTIGKEIAPYGKVWRTGANEATSIEFSKAVKVEGKSLAAGKYSIYSIPGEKEWTIIINKKATGSGMEYNQNSDTMRFTVKTGTAPTFTERLKFVIDPAGSVSFVWGDKKVTFTVK